MAPGGRARTRGRALKKKALTCDGPAPAGIEFGRRVYNGRCYFCHGYGGDARTEAARYLEPQPRDFRRALELDVESMIRTIRHGRTDTAMKGFAGILTSPEIEAVARFIELEFIRCDGANTRYHTAENGWPDHAERNGEAFPFVTGAVPVDRAPARLSADERRGLAIFRKSCVVCHDAGGQAAGAESGRGTIERLAPVVGGGPGHDGTGEGAATGQHPRDADGHHDDHGTDGSEGGYGGEYERSDHDRPPPLSNPTPAEAMGQRLYQRNCALCHAADGTGRNWIGRFLEPHPPDLTAPEWAERAGDSRLRRAILEGRPETSMPAFRAALSADQANAIIAYMRRAFRH